jgi:hypothetical protein
MMQQIGWVLLGAVMVEGCGSSKSNKSSVAPPIASASVTVSNQDAVPTPNPASDLLNPPANIDVKSCAQHTRGSKYDLAPIEACGDCCGKLGFTGGTFEYKDVCTCGKLREPANDKVCATPEGLASGAACETCCKGAAYRGHTYGSGMGITACVCEGRTEDKACAGKAASEACRVCCYNAGYFGVKWTAPSTCLCSG